MFKILSVLTVTRTWGQVHLGFLVYLYLKVFKCFTKEFVFDVYKLKVFVFKHFPKVFDISNTFSNTFATFLQVNTEQ